MVLLYCFTMTVNFLATVLPSPNPTGDVLNVTEFEKHPDAYMEFGEQTFKYLTFNYQQISSYIHSYINQLSG